MLIMLHSLGSDLSRLSNQRGWVGRGLVGRGSWVLGRGSPMCGRGSPYIHVMYA